MEILGGSLLTCDPLEWPIDFVRMVWPADFQFTWCDPKCFVKRQAIETPSVGTLGTRKC